MITWWFCVSKHALYFLNSYSGHYLHWFIFALCIIFSLLHCVRILFVQFWCKCCWQISEPGSVEEGWGEFAGHSQSHVGQERLRVSLQTHRETITYSFPQNKQLHSFNTYLLSSHTPPLHSKIQHTAQSQQSQTGSWQGGSPWLMH